MPNDFTLVAVNSRIKALCDVLIAETSRNPGFLDAVEKILLSPEIKVKIHSKKSKSSVPSINAVQIFQQSGESGLREFLSNLTTDDIRKYVTMEKFARSQETRNLDREKLVALLMERTHKRLNQGSVFINATKT